MPGPSDDGGEDGSRGVVSREAGLAHAGAIVHYEGGNIVVTHLGSENNRQQVSNNKRIGWICYPLFKGPPKNAYKFYYTNKI